MSGSDRSATHNTEELAAHGATIFLGHDAANVGDADMLVYTGALWPDNPEYLRAVERGIPVLHRSQALAWLINQQRLIAVAGAHGKTTSTGMIITALVALGADPSFVNGGVIQSLGVSSHRGSGELFVVEADESDGTFLLYDTAVALITNVDADHLDHYGSREAFDDAFVQFAWAAKELVVVSSDDAGARAVIERLDGRRILTFGEDAGADVRVQSISAQGPVSFTLDLAGRRALRHASRAGQAQCDQRRRRLRRAGGARLRSGRRAARCRAVRRHRAAIRVARHRAWRAGLRRLRPPSD